MAVLTRMFAAASVLSFVLVSSGPAAVGALSNDQHLGNRDAHLHHAGRVRRASAPAQKNAKRCKPRPGSSTSIKPSSTKAAPAPTKKPSQNNGGGDKGGDDDDGGSGGGSNVGGEGAGAPPSKKALAWSNGVDNHLKDFINDGIKLYYNWQARENPTAKDLGLTYAPMLWGHKNVDDFRKVAGNYKYLMGMNEVSLGAQADMSVGDGVALWNKEIRPYGKKGKYLVAPSVTTAPDGVDWLEGFFKQCGGNDKCGVDALSIHYYGRKASEAIEYSTKLHNQFGLPVWISEFACMSFGGPNAGACSDSEAKAYNDGLVGWALSTSWVHMIAPYGMMKDLGNVGDAAALMGSSGMPTALGRQYINA